MESGNTQSMTKKSFGWSQTIGLGVIILLIAAGVWTTVRLGPYLPDTFNKIATALVTMSERFIPGEKLLLSADRETVNSGDEIVLSWIHRNKKNDGVYSLSYTCTTGVYLGVRVAAGDKMLLCDLLSDIYGTENTVTLRAFSELNEPVTIPITVTYTSATDAGKTLSSSINLSITGSKTEAVSEIKPDTDTNSPETVPKVATPPAIPEQKSKTVTPGTKTEKIYPFGTTTRPALSYGKVDLAPKIIEVGVIDKVTNAFTATTALKVSDRIAIRFEVENLGTLDSGHWQFNAVLPTYPMYIFESEGQQPLGPGDKIEFTIGFDNVEPDVDGRFVINVDPTSSIPEASETNNIATTTIRATR